MSNSRDEKLRQQLISLLIGHDLFGKSLSPEKINEFARKANIAFYEQGAKIIKQGDKDEKFGIVMGGQLRAGDNARVLNYYTAGDIIGLDVFLGDGIWAATVEAETDVFIAVYDGADWQWLLAQHPLIRDGFKDLERNYEERTKAHFPRRCPDDKAVSREEGELYVACYGRHILAFVARLALPVILLIVPVLILFVAELLNAAFLSITLSNLLLIALVVVPFIILAALLTGLHYWDWRNDDFVVTTKNVIHTERVLFYRMERHEAPLVHIQNVTITSRSFLHELIGSHDIQINTAGAGVIFFDNVPAANILGHLILLEQKRARARVAADDRGKIHNMLVQEFDPSSIDVPSVDMPKLPARRLVPKPDLAYFWPKVEEVKTPKPGEKGEESITWRKHYFILLGRIILPALFLVILIYLFSASFFAWPPVGFLDWPIRLVLGVAILGSLFWYLWAYDGWWRNRYIVTETRIIDIESSPFRLGGEQRREGSFDSIQNITFEIPNFFYTVLNLGDVVIETAAGAGGDFTFEKVFRPGSVQKKIFAKWEGFQTRRQEKTRDDTYKQIVTVIGVYRDM